MTLNDIEDIQFHEKYSLKFLEEIQCDNISSIFGDEKVLYVVPNLFTDYLMSRRDVVFERNSAINKKRSIYSNIRTAVRVVSIDYTKNYKKRYYPMVEEGDIMHLPIIRIAPIVDRIFQVIVTVLYLFRNRNTFDSILFYNFYVQTSIPALIAKFILRKKIYVDFEDAYEENTFMSFIRRIISTYIDGGILVNRNQLELLPRMVESRYAIVNTYANLSYTRMELERVVDKVKFIYSGKIDLIRGVDLIVDFSWKMHQEKIDHQIVITGYGEINECIKNHPKYDDVHSYIEILGFVDKEVLDALMRDSDVALSFDRPDEAKNRYLFPSKTQMYASYRLPILRLVS